MFIYTLKALKFLLNLLKKSHQFVQNRIGIISNFVINDKYRFRALLFNNQFLQLFCPDILQKTNLLILFLRLSILELLI